MKKVLMITAAFAVAGLIHADIQPLAGTNVVGFTEIAAPGGSSAVITVPFEACMTDGVPGMLSDLVSTYSLTSHSSDASQADQLIVLTTNATKQVYYYYYNDTEDGWKAITSQQLMPDGTSEVQTPPAANTFAVSRGLGFWIKRVASANSTVYVKGQVTSAKQATPISAGLNLIGYAALESFSLNDKNWAGAAGAVGLGAGTDQIIVSTGGGATTTYFYYVDDPGEDDAQFTNRWVKSTSTGLALPSANVPAGQGFWYYRAPANGNFTFRPDGE